MSPRLVHPPRRRSTRRALALAVTAALAMAACSGGGSNRAARPRATSTSAPVVLGEKVIAAPNAADSGATRLTLGDGTAVLVPVGALAKGAEVRVTTSAAEGLSQGAIEGGTTAYDVAVTTGGIAKPIAVQLALADAPDRSGAIAVRFDEATRTWQPVNSDASPGTLTIYAAKPGRYSWVRWNWQAAAAVAAQTVAAIVGPTDPGEAELACGRPADLAPRFRARATGSGTLAWCAGVDAGADTLAVANAATVPVTLRQRGLGPGAVARRDAFTAALADLVRPYAAPGAGATFDLLAPGERVSYNLTVDVEAALTMTVDGQAQAYQSLGAAAAFTAGLYAGSAPVALAILQRDEPVRTALFQALGAPGCADTAVAAGATTRSAAEWGDAAQRLVLACVPDAVVRRVVDAAAKQSALRAAFTTATSSMPAASRPLVGPSLVRALTPLMETEGAGSVTLVPVPPEPTTTTVAPAIPGTPTETTAPAVTTTTPSPVQTTTVVTAPPTGVTTTVVVAATSTTVAATAPVLAIVGPTACSDRGGAAGSISLLGAGFTTRGAFTLTYTSPGGARRNVGGTATTAGAFSATFDCRSQARGEWKVTARDNAIGTVTTVVTFTVARL